LPEDEGMLPSQQESPDRVVEQHERLELVRQALRGLRGEEQEVFLLRQNGGMTYEEIAEAVGIPLGTVKTRMRLALTKLRQVLAET
jgi:RNA polymerase sigma-70 factor (ECF subfamily)